MITPETIGVTVTYKKPVTFHLRMITIPEESALRQKMFGLTDEEKAEKSYQNNVDILADLSVKSPDGIDEKIKASGKVTDFAKEVVQAYFAERTVLKERLAEYAVRGYFYKLQPEVFFT